MAVFWLSVVALVIVAYGSAYAYDTSPYSTDTYHPDYDEGGYPYTSPVSSFTISFGFEHPADFSSSGVRLRVVGIWKPVEYQDSARPQVEVINQDVGAGHALVPDFQALADYVLTLATSRYPQHTITEGAPA